MKMMNNKTSLALAVATALGVVSPQAFAIVKISSDATIVAMDPTSSDHTALGGTVQFAAEQSGESTLTLMSNYKTGTATAGKPFDGDLTAAISVPASYQVTSAKTLSFKVTLTGGAKFAKTPYAVCPFPGTNNSTVVEGMVSATVDSTTWTNNKSALLLTAMSGGIAIDAANKATATFNVPAGFITRFDGLCYITMAPTGSPAAMVTAYTVGDRGTVGMSVETTYVQGGVKQTVTANGNLLKFVTALKAVISPKDTPGNTTPIVTIDVKQGSKKFESYGNPILVSPTNATLGSVKLNSANANSKIRIAAESALGWTVSTLMTTGTVTINGPLMAGVQSVALYNGTCAAGASVAAGTPTATTGGGGNVSVTAISVVNLVLGLNICGIVDGTKVLNAGQLSAVLTGGGVDKFAPNLGAETDIVNVKINGARLRVLNIPASNAADLAYIRFYNTGSQDAAVTATLYGMDGKVLGTPDAVLFGPLKSNDVEVLDAAKLEKKFGLTAPWTGRVWMLVQAEIDKDLFRVQALIRSPSGALINMSTDTTN